MSGTDILHVAYKGSTGARNDLIGGHVNMMFDEIAVLGAERARADSFARWASRAQAPLRARCRTSPTVSEAGVPGYEHTGWFGFMVPAGTPKRDRRPAHAEIKALIAKPEVKANWAKQAPRRFADARGVGGLPARRDGQMGTRRSVRRPPAIKLE